MYLVNDYIYLFRKISKINKNIYKYMKTEILPFSKIYINSGQIKDVPKNPRFIKDDRFLALKKSIQDDPEMILLRELVVYDNGDGQYVVVMGNMRYRAMKDLGYKEASCKILPYDTSAKKIRAYIQKDNISFGQNDWDLLANEWEMEELQEFGLECNFLNIDERAIDEFFENIENKKESKDKIVEICIPASLSDQIENIKKAIQTGIAGFDGVYIK